MTGWRSRVRACAAAVAIIAAVPALAQQVYRYKDERRQWVYTDRAPSVPGSAETVNVATGAAPPRMLVQPRNVARGIAFVAVNECACPVEFGVKAAGADGRERAGRGVVAPRSEQVLLEVEAPPGTGAIRFDYGVVARAVAQLALRACVFRDHDVSGGGLTPFRMASKWH